MRVLVTGAAGFIGSHVCRALIKAGHYVTGVDLVQNTELDDFIVADICKPFAAPRFDAMVHLAAIASPNECDADPERAFNINVNGTHQALKIALESGARKVVFSSSAHVYDIPPRYLPTDESHPLRLNKTYTTTKILGEQLCHLFFENHGLSYTTLRLYNAYGPGQTMGYFIPDQIAKAKKGRIDLYGSDVSKDWVYVEDVADAFCRAIDTRFVGAINIGTGIETKLGVVARAIANIFGADLETHPAERPTRMQCDGRRASAILGWSPTTPLEEGLRAAINSAKARPIPA